jgi:hypothetical protein
LRDKYSTIAVEKCVGSGGWMWMIFRLIPSHPQRHGHSSNGAEVIIHEWTVERTHGSYAGTRLEFSVQRHRQTVALNLSPLSTAPITIDYSLLSIQIKRKKKRRFIPFMKTLSTSHCTHEVSTIRNFTYLWRLPLARLYPIGGKRKVGYARTTSKPRGGDPCCSYPPTFSHF